MSDTTTSTMPANDESAEPTGRGRKTAIIAVVVTVAVVALAGAAWAGWAAYQNKLEAERTARIVAASAKLDSRIEKAFEQIDELDRSWEDIATAGDSELMETELAESAEQVDTLVRELESVQKDAASIESTPVGAQYKTIAYRMTVALKGARLSEDDAKTDIALLKATTAGDKSLRRANDLINASIESCNKRKYNDALGKANSAKKACQSALSTYRAASKLDDSGDIDDTVAFAKAYLAYADGQARLAQLGKQGSVNGYNSQIGKLRKQVAKLSEMDAYTMLDEGIVVEDATYAYASLSETLKNARDDWHELQIEVAKQEF